jgi:hypothetical protein
MNCSFLSNLQSSRWNLELTQSRTSSTQAYAPVKTLFFGRLPVFGRTHPKILNDAKAVGCFCYIGGGSNLLSAASTLPYGMALYYQVKGSVIVAYTMGHSVGAFMLRDLPIARHQRLPIGLTKLA